MRENMRRGTEHYWLSESLFYLIIYFFNWFQINPKAYPYIEMVDRRVQVP